MKGKADMAENYSFFNSNNHDRTYNARHWADYFFPLFKSGVFNGDLQVVANGGMSVKIKEGYAWIDGYGYHLTDALVIDLDMASGNMNRVDSIVIRLDLTNRWIKAFCKTGSYYTGSGVAPAPDITTTVHEIVIAHVSVNAGVIEITQDMIKDTRMDGTICGWVCSTVKEIEFKQISAQFDSFQESKKAELTNKMREFMSESGNEFNEWFNVLKTQLSTDAAGNLQNQINSINAVLREITADEIDDIIYGRYKEDSEGGIEPDIYSRITSDEIKRIVDNAFGEEVT